jgi:hypothetical protein
MAQDEHGEIYFATKAGVLEFDGFNWNVISVPGAVYTLVAQGTNVLLGGLTGAGKLRDKIQSPRSYEIFSETNGIFSSAQHDNRAYFCSAKKLVIYSFGTQSIESTIAMSSATGDFLGVFNLGEEIVVRTENKGLFRIENSTLVPFDFAFTNPIFSTLSPSKNSLLIGTKDNRIFALKNRELKEIVPQQSDFLSHNILTDGVWVSENMLAIGI